MWLIEGAPAGALSLIRNTGQKHSTAKSRPFMEENHAARALGTLLTHNTFADHSQRHSAIGDASVELQRKDNRGRYSRILC